ncbi:MAG: ABC-F type ribosomal protection protein [Oscillospiraceae bacterium]|nr:ABC-F type ribosomal protection protein [Oscillospiraceae bacterium]
MSLIDISNLTFAHEGGDNLFENVSFQIDTDWKLGFTGRNGRGKTTFLNLLLGKYPYQGGISASVEFEYFPFEVADKSKDTLDVLKEIDGGLPQWALLREFSLLELGEDALRRPFCTLSNGEQTKALLAALFLKENRFLLIDEPTNHLDMHGREIVSRYLSGKEGFIVVSHDRAFLDGCVDHILSINKADIEIQRGNFSSWLANKERRDRFELSENEKLKKDIRRLEKTAREKAAWSDTAEQRKIGFDPVHEEKYIGRRPLQGAKAKKMMKRAKAIETRRQTAVEEKSKLLKNLESAEALKVTQLAYHANRLLSLEDVSIFYGEKTACRGVRFTVERGDRVALCGRNGSGKSSVLKLILGEELAYTGSLLVGSGLKISYVSQDPSFLSGNLSDYAAREQIDESLFKTILRKLDFSRAQFEKDMRDFSFGQKKKVLIAKSLCERAHLLVWDEPLNFIDVLSRIQIEDLLLAEKPTILFVEHDREFCRNVATKTVEL